jgi:hypothetical protein
MDDTVCIVMRMETHTTPAASVAHQPPMGATADCPQHAADRGAAANYKRAEAFGPPITSDLRGAGGPFNSYDSQIARYRAAGEHRKAAELQEARARVNIFLLQQLEPVWVPTPHQRVMLALRAGAARDGFAAVAA